MKILAHHEYQAPVEGDTSVLGDVPVTSYDDLPEGARRRLCLRPGQVNALVRLTLRAVDRTLTATEANRLRDAVYLAVHEGEVAELAVPAG